MKRLINYSWLLAGVLWPKTMLAQTHISWGPCLGGNAATVLQGTRVFYDAEVRPEFVVGPQAGLMADIRWGKLSFQPHLLYSRKGYKYETGQPGTSGYQQYNLRLNYLEVPLNAVYTTGGDKGFQVFAGPYLGIGISGWQWYTTDWANKGNFPLDYGTDFRRLDAGVNGGVGYRVAQLQVQVGYGLGLTNLRPSSGGSGLHNQVIQLSGAFLFTAK
ncbi:MAG: hypothetical protein JWP58_4214 [Hymenobacter sp.]|nr:hypothetical protein [Hymenobacter sp.]